jgi:hypothetical protein
MSVEKRTHRAEDSRGVRLGRRFATRAFAPPPAELDRRIFLPGGGKTGSQ